MIYFQPTKQIKKEAFIASIWPVAQLCAVNNAILTLSNGKELSNFLYICVRKAWAHFIAKVWFLHCNIIYYGGTKTTVTGE